MVSQANFFRDDYSGALFDTPLEAIKSEEESKKLKNKYAYIAYAE